MKNTNKILDGLPIWRGFNDEIIFFAFKYALGRRTGVASTVVDYLKENWKDISYRFRDLIVKEIKQAIKENMAGHDCDIEKWKEILDL